MNLIYFLGKTELKSALEPIMTLLGYAIFTIKVLVPVILVIVGMYDLAQSIISKDDDQIKKAQKLLVKKLVAGICVFLVISMVTLIMKVILSGADDSEKNDWIDATKCAFDPFDNCKLVITKPSAG